MDPLTAQVVLASVGAAAAVAVVAAALAAGLRARELAPRAPQEEGPGVGGALREANATLWRENQALRRELEVLERRASWRRPAPASPPGVALVGLTAGAGAGVMAGLWWTLALPWVLPRPAARHVPPTVIVRPTPIPAPTRPPAALTPMPARPVAPAPPTPAAPPPPADTAGG